MLDFDTRTMLKADSASAAASAPRTDPTPRKELSAAAIKVAERPIVTGYSPIVLAGTVVAAAPPLLALPTTFAVYTAETPRDMAMAEPARTAFRSRAPPRS